MIDIRNIKFRVYDEQTNTMWYSHPKEYTEEFESIEFYDKKIPLNSRQRRQLPASIEFGNNVIYVNFGRSYSYDPQYKRHVMMNVGLKSGINKDEDDIFEGDIVIKHIRKCGDKVLTNPFVVEWQYDTCGFNIHNKENHWYEIIGNIYQTKDYKKLLSKPFKQKI